MSHEITHIVPINSLFFPLLSKTVKRTEKKTLALECATVHILVHLALIIDYIVENIVRKDQIEKNLLKKVF